MLYKRSLEIEQRIEAVLRLIRAAVFHAEARRAARRIHPNSILERNRLAGEGIRDQGRETVKGVVLRAKGHEPRESIVTQKGIQTVTNFGDKVSLM